MAHVTQSRRKRSAGKPSAFVTEGPGSVQAAYSLRGAGIVLVFIGTVAMKPTGASRRLSVAFADSRRQSGEHHPGSFSRIVLGRPDIGSGGVRRSGLTCERSLADRPGSLA
jgi:hypothetical protein